MWRDLSVFLFLILLGACSSSSGLTLSSRPEGAEVSNLQGEILGKTPLTLSPDQSSKVLENGLLNFKVAAPGYLPRLVYTDASVVRQINIVLPKSESGSFKSEFTRDFGKDMNQMLRLAFVIQKLLGQKKISDASQAIDSFKKDYPTLAYGYVMTAHLALMQGNRAEAKAALNRARAMDPDDADISQSLKMLAPGDPP